MHDDLRFQELVRRSAPLNYATRCRVVADEVRRQHAAPNPPAARAWLDEQLTTLAGEPGTIVGVALREAADGQPKEPSMAEVRAWAHRRLRPTDAAAWTAGADSRAMWALLMAPVPADDEQLNWLADSSGVEASDLRALAPGPTSLQAV